MDTLIVQKGHIYKLVPIKQVSYCGIEMIVQSCQADNG